MTQEQLMILARTLSRHTGWTFSTIGTYAVNDGKFFSRLEAGGSCTLKTASCALKWFSSNWPIDLEWPTNVARPRREPMKQRNLVQ